jgi:biotin transport system substrate-specific component
MLIAQPRPFLGPALSAKRFSTLCQIIFCSLLIALCAQIRILLPFTPVPLTLQTFAVLFIGGTLGSRYGILSVLCYLVEAVIGLPVLSGMRSDPLVLFSPVGGYLIGYIIQVYLAGWFAERQERIGRGLVFTGFILACAIQLMCGVVWVGFFVGWPRGLFLGAVPFIPGEILKVITVTSFLNRNRIRKPKRSRKHGERTFFHKFRT